MDLSAVKRSLEPPAAAGEAPSVTDFSARFYDIFLLHGLRIDLIEHGHVICSMAVVPRLLNSSGLLHCGVMATLVDLIGSAVFYSAGSPTSGVSLEISISYVDAAFIDGTGDFEKEKKKEKRNSRETSSRNALSGRRERASDQKLRSPEI